MFNLLISNDPSSWDNGRYQISRTRFAEYTFDDIRERYKLLDKKATEELKSFPVLFVVENESVESRIGYITSIQLRDTMIVIDFEINESLPVLPLGAMEDLSIDLDIHGWEMSRTHWAIKNEPLFDILLHKKYITYEQLKDSKSLYIKTTTKEAELLQTKDGVLNKSQVFIVHGQDDFLKLEMSDFIKELKLEPIILHMQPSSGMTIFEKIERYSNVKFGIILYTPCDIGAKVGDLQFQHRARQNVVFEHGFLLGKLGKNKVAVVVKGKIEKPNDISGVVYISMDEPKNWKEELKSELISAGLVINEEKSKKDI